jgi:hypothetical protein
VVGGVQAPGRVLEASTICKASQAMVLHTIGTLVASGCFMIWTVTITFRLHAGLSAQMLLMPAGPAIWTVMGFARLQATSPPQMLGLPWSCRDGTCGVMAPSPLWASRCPSPHPVHLRLLQWRLLRRFIRRLCWMACAASLLQGNLVAATPCKVARATTLPTTEMLLTDGCTMIWTVPTTERQHAGSLMTLFLIPGGPKIWTTTGHAIIWAASKQPMLCLHWELTHGDCGPSAAVSSGGYTGWPV